MEKEKLNELLDSVYELEGLIHLAINRDDMPEVLPSLIVRKGRELLRLAETVAGKTEVTDKVSVPEETGAFFEQEKECFNNNEEDELAVEDYGVDVNDEPDFLTAPEVTTPPAPDYHAEPDYDPYVEPALEPRGRLVFSINDRYRFKRGLFNQSDADFNTTLSLVASMDSYEEAEDYFLNELQWDPASGDVADFLEIIKKYFKE